MQNSNTKIVLGIIAGFLVLISVFYWFQIRPNQIKKECSRYLSGYNSVLPGKENTDVTEGRYMKCLTENGL